MKLIKNEWEIEKICLGDAKDFIEENHYANGAGDVATAIFGLYYKGDKKTLHGVALWNPPAYGAAIKVSENHRGVLSLSRFCLVPDRPENAGSFLISKSIKDLSNRWDMLVTYADTALKHDGGLYRAANWNYHGLTAKNPMYWDPINNRMVSRKKGKKTYSRTEMEAMGYIFKGNFEKHRFVYPNGNRKGIVIKPRPKEIQTQLIFTEDGRINLTDAKE